jgi:hypothetical protein
MALAGHGAARVGACMTSWVAWRCVNTLLQY